MEKELKQFKQSAKILTMEIGENITQALATCKNHRLFARTYHLNNMAHKTKIAMCVKG